MLDRDVLLAFCVAPILAIIFRYYLSHRHATLWFLEVLGKKEVTSHLVYWNWSAQSFLLWGVIPLILALAIHRLPPRQVGLTVGDWRAGAWLAAAPLGLMILLTALVSDWPDFLRTYPLERGAIGSWRLFWSAQAAMVVYMTGWEFFFRGYLIGILRKPFGLYCIFIQMLPFVFLHFGKPLPETLGTILSGLYFGWMVWRTGSIYYGIILHIGVMFSMELFAVLRWRA